MVLRLRVFCPISDAKTLKECLKMIRLCRLPRTRREKIFDLFYFGIMGLFIIRTAVPLIGLEILDKLLCFSFKRPVAYIVLQITVSLAYLEIITARCWFYHQSRKPGALDFLYILDHLTSTEQKWLVRAVKMIGSCLTVTGTCLLCSIILWETRHTASGDYIAFASQAAWYFAHIYSVRYEIYDLIAIIAVCIGLSMVLSKQMTANIIYLQNPASMRRLLREYLGLIRGILITRPLISTINSLNHATVIPFCGTVVSLVLYQTDDPQETMVTWLLIFAGVGYAMRGYVFTAFCSIPHSKSLKMHNLMASLIARGRFTISDRRVLSTIISDISSNLNHLVFTDLNDGRINQLDLLENLLDTLQFFILGIQFRGRFF